MAVGAIPMKAFVRDATRRGQRSMDYANTPGAGWIQCL